MVGQRDEQPSVKKRVEKLKPDAAATPNQRINVMILIAVDQFSSPLKISTDHSKLLMQ